MLKPVLFTVIFTMLIPALHASHLKSDEHVMFIPDIAYSNPEGELITAHVQAWVYEKERRLGMTTLLANYLGIDKSKLTEQQLTQLYARSQLFRVDSERDKDLTVKFSDSTIYSLPTTNRGGRSSAAITLKNTNAIIQPDNTIRFELYDSGNPASTDKGIAIYAPPEGYSVISDIDDTVKDSNVLDKQQLLLNTFLNDFKATQGMSQWYNKLANTSANTSFHYVSSSPIQLYPVLQEFLDNEHFPKASIHLREGTTWDSVIATKEQSKQHKLTAIQRLLTAYPKRLFILVGDSGEKDPEIYAEIKRQYPKQVVCIAIRDVTQEDSQAPRYQTTFSGIEASQWRIFTDPSTLEGWCL